MVDYTIFTNWLSISTLFIVILGFILRFVTLSNKPLRKNPVPTINCSKYGCTWLFIDMLLYVKKYRVGYALHIFLRTMNGLLHLYRKEGIFQFRLLFKTAVIFYNPETVEVLLKSTVNIDKTIPYNFLDEWLGEGLITSSGAKWHYRRKLITPTFHFRILKDVLPIFIKKSDIFVSNLHKKQSEWIDIAKFTGTAALDIIAEAAMGVPMDIQNNDYQDLCKSFSKIESVTFLRPSRPWLIPKSIFHISPTGRKYAKHLNNVVDLTKKVIKDKKEEFTRKKTVHSNEKKPGAFLELLLELHMKNPSFTLEDILEEVNTFMFAGHDTSSTTMTYTLYCLGLEENRLIQAKVHEELDNIFQGDIDREITWDDITHMKYLECVIKETLRLYPTIPLISRKAKSNFDVGSYEVEKGSMCIINIQMLHRDPSTWPNPEKFDPDRFSPENMVGRHPYAFVPFSAGLRNCIGQKFAFAEMKTILASILRNFKVTSKDPRDKINTYSNIALKSVKPVMVRFTTRL